jgi:hypothetical protein
MSISKKPPVGNSDRTKSTPFNRSAIEATFEKYYARQQAKRIKANKAAHPSKIDPEVGF